MVLGISLLIITDWEQISILLVISSIKIEYNLNLSMISTNSLTNRVVKILFSALFAFHFIPLFAQNYAIGTTSFTWLDPDRGNRAVDVKAYYPAQNTGTSSLPATGSFPSVVFAHGFSMTYTAYQHIWEYYVPKGFILLLVDMENGFTPDHSSFGADILFVGKTFKEKSAQDASFLLYQSHSGKTAFAGHSMGGGCAVLAASYEPSFPDALIGLAPAETNPSAISAAPSVIAPSCIFSGSFDAVTPPNTNHLPMYNELSSSCKIFVSITGGAHCYFANANAACDFGETVSGTNPTISRSQQQTITNSVFYPFLQVLLKEDNTQQNLLYTALSQNGIEVQNTCLLNAGIASEEISSIHIYPNPGTGVFYITNLPNTTTYCTLYDVRGNKYIVPITGNKIVLDEFASGIYMLRIGEKTRKLIIQNP